MGVYRGTRCGIGHTRPEQGIAVESPARAWLQGLLMVGTVTRLECEL